MALAASVLVAAACGGAHTPPRVVPSRALPPRGAAPAPPAPEGTSGAHHVVRPGQTLWRIARAYGLPADDLARANGIEDPSRVDAGTVLFVPGARAPVEVAPHPAPAPAPVHSEGPAPGERVGDGSFSWPIPGGEILSVFGDRRGRRRHEGVDIRGRRKQPVLAARAGTVVYAGGTMRGYGKTVILEHGDGVETLYAHNSKLLVKPGERVERGQPVALVGRSGNATTEHCHFEIRRGSTAVDPLSYLARGSEAP